MFASETAMIGAAYNQSWPGRPTLCRITFRVPSSLKKALSRYAATTSGSTQAPITAVPTKLRTTFVDRRISRASPSPRVFWPMIAETRVKTRVSQIELVKAELPKALRKLSNPTNFTFAAPVPVNAMFVNAA